jgi:hypothetical protein
MLVNYTVTIQIHHLEMFHFGMLETKKATLTACFFVGNFPMILSMTALVTGSLLWKFAAGSTSVGFAGGPGVGAGAGPVTAGRGSGATSG